MVLPVFPTLAIGVVSLVVWCLYKAWQRRQQYPPGPLSIPIVENITSMMELQSWEKVWVKFTRLQKEHGDVFTVFLLNQPTVILGSLETIKEALETKQNDFEGRPHTYFTEYFSKGGKSLTFGQAGPVWKIQRKITHDTFRRFASGECIDKYIQQSFKKSSRELEKVANTGKAFNPKHCINMTVYNMIISMVFGKMFEHNDPVMTKFIRIMDELNEVFTTGLLADFIPIFRYIPTKGLTNFHESIDSLHKMVKDVYEEHRKTFDESNLRDIVDQVLQTVTKLKRDVGEKATDDLTEEHYLFIIMEIFTAGTNTSRMVLVWAILYMTAFPECQKKIQEEVDTVIGHDSPVLVDHRPRLPYTNAFLYEVMRIRPIAPTSVAHMTTCDTSVGGHPIPAGTQVMPNFWALHMNKEAWGDPEAFRPERFLDDNGQMGPHIPSYMPFSTGTRACNGEALAKAELHLLVAAFAQKFEFRTPPGMVLDLKPKTPGQLMAPEDFDVIINKRA